LISYQGFYDVTQAIVALEGYIAFLQNSQDCRLFCT